MAITDQDLCESPEPSNLVDGVPMETDDDACGNPCSLEEACDQCVEYWQMMRDEGYWKDGTGWTDKGLRDQGWARVRVIELYGQEGSDG